MTCDNIIWGIVKSSKESTARNRIKTVFVTAKSFHYTVPLAIMPDGAVETPRGLFDMLKYKSLLTVERSDFSKNLPIQFREIATF